MLLWQAMNVSLVVLLYALWSSVFPLGKATLDFAPPVFLTGFRMTLAGVVLCLFYLLVKRSSFKFEKKHWISIGLLAFLSIYLTNVLEFWGLQHLSAAKTCFIYSLSPFFAALFSYFHFKEKINVRKGIGLGIGFIGILPVLLSQTGTEDLFKVTSFLSLPTLAIMGAALFSVYGWVLLRVVVKSDFIPPALANGLSMLIGGIFAFIHSFITDSWSPTPIMTGHIGDFFKGTLLMTLISNIICFNLYGMLLRRYTATFLSFVGLLSPVFASISSWIILGETPSLTILGSTGIVCIGLFIVYQAELKQGYIVSKVKAPEEAE